MRTLSAVGCNLKAKRYLLLVGRLTGKVCGAVVRVRVLIEI